MQLWTRLLVCLLVVVMSAVQVGCAGPQKQDEDVNLTDKRRGPPAFFENIPADTPYVLAGLEPVPMSAFAGYMTGYADFVEQFRSKMDELGAGDMPSAVRFYMELAARMVKAWESEDGLEALGMKKNAHLAVYGIGWHPAYRIELEDPAKFEQMIAEVEAETGFGGDIRKLGEQEYRYYELQPDSVVAVAFTDSELLVGMAPTEAFDVFLPYLLGQKLPEQSLSDTKKIQDLVGKYGFDAFGAGYLNTKQLAAVVLGEEAPHGVMKEMLDAIGYEPPATEAGCRRDMLGFVERHPRMVFGYTEFTTTSLGFQVGLESTTDLPARIAGTKTEIPNYKAGGDDLLAAVGAGVEVSALLDVLAAEAKGVSEDPYECSEMSDINKMATQASTYLRQVPPFVRDMRGVRVELRGLDFDPKTMKVQRLDAVALVETEKPSTLLAQLQMYVPQFNGVGVQANGVPVAIKPFQSEPYIKVPHVAMTEDTLAVSMGVGMQDELAIMLEGEGDSATPKDTPLFVMGYDYGRLFYEYDRILQSQPHGPLGFGELASMFGFVEMRFDVTEDGYFGDFKMELNPDVSASNRDD